MWLKLTGPVPDDGMGISPQVAQLERMAVGTSHEIYRRPPIVPVSLWHHASVDTPHTNHHTQVPGSTRRKRDVSHRARVSGHEQEMSQ